MRGERGGVEVDEVRFVRPVEEDEEVGLARGELGLEGAPVKAVGEDGRGSGKSKRVPADARAVEIERRAKERNRRLALVGDLDEVRDALNWPTLHARGRFIHATELDRHRGAAVDLHRETPFKIRRVEEVERDRARSFVGPLVVETKTPDVSHAWLAFGADTGQPPDTARRKLARVVDLPVADRGALDTGLTQSLGRGARGDKPPARTAEFLGEPRSRRVGEKVRRGTANGRLRVNIMLSVAENESDRTSERIKFVFDGKRRRKEWCFTGGPAQWPYGYMPQVIDGVKRCVKNPETAPIVQDFWDYVVSYNSIRKAGMYVCEKYGITRNYRTWMVTARNELYTGTFHGVEDYCPAYISRADWERIVLGHEIIKKTQSPDRVYLFTGMIRCPECGNTLKATFKTYPNDRTKEYNGYRCNNGKLRTCTFNHQLSERKIEKYLLGNIQSLLQEQITTAEVAEKERRQQPKAMDAVNLAEKLRRLNTIYMAGNISDEDYMTESRRLKAAIEKAKAQDEQNAPPNLEALRAFLQSDFLTIYDSLSKEDRHRIWRSVIQEILIDGTTPTGIIPRL